MGGRNYLPESSQTGVTLLLRAWAGGDPHALDQLTPIVYAELRRMARRYMRRENPENSLQATALVHEAYLKLVDVKMAHWQDRAHFFAVSARLMRRILVDAARARDSDKRGGEAVRVELNESLDGAPVGNRQMLRLDDALAALAQFDPRKASVVELRFFGGLEVDETAAVLKVSPQTVMRDWKLARAWLAREMEAEG
jgi:RNA polymerase sigma-70 factor, ECF subfamily